MSRYETYDRALASVFVRARPALGAAFVRRELLRVAGRTGGRPVAALDAGCGTGAYLPSLDAAGARVVGVDLSRSMLEVGSGRCGVQASVDCLPFRDSQFDFVLASQVLHHLEAGDDAGYERSRWAIAELARVIGDGGSLVLSVCFEDQLAAGFWYYSLIPEARERATQRCTPRRLLFDALGDVGMTVQRSHIPGEPMQGTAYFDATGPLQLRWRKTDSIWSLVTEDELAAAVAQVEDLQATGQLDDYLTHHDTPRAITGQMTFLTAGFTRNSVARPPCSGAAPRRLPRRLAR